MKVILNNEYYIEQIDDWNVVLRKAYVSYGSGKAQFDEPKMVVKELGYYRTVKQALGGFLRQTQTENTADFNGQIEEYIKRIEDIDNNAVDRMLKGVRGNGKNS